MSSSRRGSCQRLARIGFTILAGFGLVTAYAKDPMMSETKTYCVGRFLVDVPKDAEINGQSNEFIYGRIESEKTQIDPKAFAAQMEKREATLKAVNPDKSRSLKEAYSVGLSGKVLVTFENVYGDKDYGFEAYKLDHDRLFSLKQKNFDETVFRNEVSNRLKNDLLPRLRNRQPDEIPSEPGFCIKDGFIADNAAQTQYENASISFHFPRWPDLVITVSTVTVSKAGEKTLLQRVDGHPLPAVYASVAGQLKTLRRGTHDVGDRKGEEILELLPTDEGIKQHSFRWEASGTKDKVLLPDIVLEYESGTPLNGHPRRPTLSDDEATKLFDSVVNSIRLRPTGPAKVSSADPTPSSPQAPLGEVVATGAVCPQTGWWQCIETGNIDGGRRRFFKSGEAMPAAVLLGDANMWQTLRGQRPSHSLNTVWSLVAYEQIAAAPIPATIKTDADDTPGTSLPGESTPG
ncbi:T6SS immunity protein Tli4 family protein [Collimonas pratensis]|nr:T6SS immunity protein Tli4 family protein [Collimonas pratensis]